MYIVSSNFWASDITLKNNSLSFEDKFYGGLYDSRIQPDTSVNIEVSSVSLSNVVLFPYWS